MPVDIYARLAPQPHAPPWQRLTVVVAYLAAIASLALVILFAIQYANSRSDNEDQVREDALLKVASAAAAIDTVLESLERDVTDLTDRINSGEIQGWAGTTGLGSRMTAPTEANQFIRRMGVFYAPDDSGGIFAPYGAKRVVRDVSGLEHADDPLDYTLPASEAKTGYEDPNRYHVPVRDGESWITPFRDESTGFVIAEYGSRFGDLSSTEPEQGGVLYADFSFDFLEQIVQWLSLRETGYSFMLSPTGTYLAHPVDAYVDEHMRISDRAESQSVILSEALAALSRGEQIVLDYPDEVTGRDSLLALESTSQGWPIGYVVFRDQVFSRSTESKQALMRIALASIALLFFLFLVWSRAYAGSWAGLWLTSGLLSVLFIGGVGTIWYWHATTPPRLVSARVNLGDAISAHHQAFEDAKEAGSPFIDDEILESRVGMQITSVEFATTEVIKVQGIVWQTFHDRGAFREEIPIKTGLFLPDAIEGTGLIDSKNAAYGPRRQFQDEQFGWYFNAIFPTEFDFTRYPFDRERVSIRIIPNDLGRGVLNVPDLNNYDTLLPSELPGVHENLSIDGWNVNRSYFNYNVSDPGTEFGLVNTTLDHTTELAFNVEISRSFIGPFISNMLPLVVIALLLFVAVMITTKMPHFVLAIAGRTPALGSGELGSSGSINYTGSPTYGLIATMAVMAYTVSLFFAIVLAHARLRGQFPDAGVLYLEWYYFVAYLAVLGVTINAISYAAHVGGGFIHFRENLIPRVSYWPINTGFLFAVTWLSFYGE